MKTISVFILIALALTAQLPYLHGSGAPSYSEDLLKLFAIAESMRTNQGQVGVTQNASLQQQAGGFVTADSCSENFLVRNPLLHDMATYGNDFSLEFDCFNSLCTSITLKLRGEETQVVYLCMIGGL